APSPGELVRARDDVDRAAWRAGQVNDLRELVSTGGCLRRGFDHHRVPGRERGSDLVSDEIQREVERRDAEHGTDRKPLVERAVALVTGKNVRRNELARETLGLLGGEREGIETARDLPARERDRFPGFS